MAVLDILVIVIVILTVFGFMLTMLFGGGNGSPDTSGTTARSAPISSNNTYAYDQQTSPYVQPSYSQPQNTIQGRAGFSQPTNSVAGDINSGVITGGAIAGAGVAAGAFSPQTTQNSAYGISSSGQVIGLRPIEPLSTPYIPTTAPQAAFAGRSAITQGSNPAAPYSNHSNGNAAIYIDTTQSYHPQNQELVMNQACVNEVWQRNPYVIRNFSNLSVRLSATNPTANGNMRTYSFNLDNRPTGNGALCTVTTDGYVTAVSFY